VERLAFDKRTTWRGRQGAASCCTASSSGEAMEAKRARLHKRIMRWKILGRIRDCQLLLVMGLSIAISGVVFHDRAMGPGISNRN